MQEWETVWYASEGPEERQNEYGPFKNALEAVLAALKVGAGYLHRYDRQLYDEYVREHVSTIALFEVTEKISAMYVRCATCGEAASFPLYRECELWADIHEFEHLRHMVRFFFNAKEYGLTEVPNWRMDPSETVV